MFADGSLRSARGWLAAPGGRGAELAAAIGQATRDETGLGGAGIGVALSGEAQQPLLAHVLPLRHREGVAGLPDRTEAAVFLSGNAGPTTWPQALAAYYGLTPAEARVAGAIAAGLTRAEAAARLGVATSTVKTHLERIFAKTQASSQRDLARLAASLTPPARR
jgi:DNA-binding CsgD family transcriptional regulator